MQILKRDFGYVHATYTIPIDGVRADIRRAVLAQFAAAIRARGYVPRGVPKYSTRGTVAECGVAVESQDFRAKTETITILPLPDGEAKKLAETPPAARLVRVPEKAAKAAVFPCKECGADTRPAGVPEAAYPGTVRAGCRGMCGWCYRKFLRDRKRPARRKKTPAKKTPAVKKPEPSLETTTPGAGSPYFAGTCAQCGAVMRAPGIPQDRLPNSRTYGGAGQCKNCVTSAKGKH
ncbi:Uncharacterised protein [Actinobaculum suis]|uniref:Uncharacterized protein n=1 Tax=Actinobaculum suis TaxID=1657 RepID=A0A7Z8YA07_9ACTO|nr:Uncharacterised protein [Actinobaculum suis]VDG77317.1 Uncharacterised protein [Actinobaculum suis]